MEINSNLHQQKPAKPNTTRIRRKIGGRGFYHQNRVVEEGETIECDHDIASTMVSMGKAEFVE